MFRLRSHPLSKCLKQQSGALGLQQMLYYACMRGSVLLALIISIVDLWLYYRCSLVGWLVGWLVWYLSYIKIIVTVIKRTATAMNYE